MQVLLVRSPTTVCLFTFLSWNWSCKAMSLGENLPRGIRENSPKRGGLCITHAGRHPTTGPQHTKLACALIITAPSLERCMGLRSYLVGDSVSNIPLSSFLTDFFKHPILYYNIYICTVLPLGHNNMWSFMGNGAKKMLESSIRQIAAIWLLSQCQGFKNNIMFKMKEFLIKLLRFFLKFGQTYSSEIADGDKITNLQSFAICFWRLQSLDICGSHRSEVRIVTNKSLKVLLCKWLRWMYTVEVWLKKVMS